MYRINDPMCNMYFHVQSSGVHMYATYTTLINTIGILIISLEDMIQALKTNLHKKIDKVIGRNHQPLGLAVTT